MLKPLAVVPYNLIQTRYSPDKLLKRLIYLDYAYMRGLTKVTEGAQRNWVQVFKKSPYTYGYLVNARLDILGYWHFVSLKEPYFKKAKLGLLLDSEIKASSIYALNKKGLYTVYIIETMLLPKYRDTNAIMMLDNSFFDRIYDFARSGIYFTEVLANAFTADGKRRDINRGMQIVAKNTSHGDIYHMDFTDFLLKNATERTDLINAYSKYLKRKTTKSRN